MRLGETVEKLFHGLSNNSGKSVAFSRIKLLEPQFPNSNASITILGCATMLFCLSFLWVGHAKFLRLKGLYKFVTPCFTRRVGKKLR